MRRRTSRAEPFERVTTFAPSRDDTCNVAGGIEPMTREVQLHSSTVRKPIFYLATLSGLPCGAQPNREQKT
jgi:hypothetical protein